ncbi:hypothetical protein M885DRAFT_586886 [Pelagophyceae sp. CCMP2097]|nr:hypothetical protein M885DRAFT_586886 [Pelagophyceae sp. CCMP2097]
MWAVLVCCVFPALVESLQRGGGIGGVVFKRDVVVFKKSKAFGQAELAHIFREQKAISLGLDPNAFLESVPEEEDEKYLPGASKQQAKFAAIFRKQREAEVEDAPATRAEVQAKFGAGINAANVLPREEAPRPKTASLTNSMRRSVWTSLCDAVSFDATTFEEMNALAKARDARFLCALVSARNDDGDVAVLEDVAKAFHERMPKKAGVSLTVVMRGGNAAALAKRLSKRYASSGIRTFTDPSGAFIEACGLTPRDAPRLVAMYIGEDIDDLDDEIAIKFPLAASAASNVPAALQAKLTEFEDRRNTPSLYQPKAYR